MVFKVKEKKNKENKMWELDFMAWGWSFFRKLRVRNRIEWWDKEGKYDAQENRVYENRGPKKMRENAYLHT